MLISFLSLLSCFVILFVISFSVFLTQQVVKGLTKNQIFFLTFFFYYVNVIVFFMKWVFWFQKKCRIFARDFSKL